MLIFYKVVLKVAKIRIKQYVVKNDQTKYNILIFRRKLCIVEVMNKSFIFKSFLGVIIDVDNDRCE